MKSIDKDKIKKIKKILRKNPNGLWIREIARKAGLDKSTVSIYINKHMTTKLKIKKFGSLKLVQLK